MTTWVIIPVKALDQAKMRLAKAMTPPARAGLVRAMLAHVVTTAQAAPSVDHLTLIGPSRHGLPASLPLLPDPDQGLNPALTAALAHAAAQGATRAIILPADLPQLTTADINRLAATPVQTIAIAPDRHGTGTNALSLPLPAAAGFTFAFGPDSRALHQAETARLGLALEEVHSPGLANDIDHPADLPDAAAMFGEGFVERVDEGVKTPSPH